MPRKVVQVIIEQRIWSGGSGWVEADGTGAAARAAAQLVFAFGSREILADTQHWEKLCDDFPRALICACSTSGEICGTRVTDDSLVVTAVKFSHTAVRGASIPIKDASGSFAAGRNLAKSIDPRGLVHAFVLSDGLWVNGSELVKGLTDALPPGVAITGGLSGDGARFQRTLVSVGNADAAEPPAAGRVGIVGFYGDRLRVGYASVGGWDPFGPERIITRAEGNVLYELDGRSALDLYNDYLGEHAAGLPASGLLFPLSIRSSPGDCGVVRTILGVDEKSKTMTFAGDLPQGSYARLMRANLERLVDGATAAARTSQPRLGAGAVPVQLAVLISCVGRKLVLQQRVEDEVDAVREVLGPTPALCGFYSYGEISPFAPSARCELHNQTMTITTFSET